jgi:hypothetical protein
MIAKNDVRYWYDSVRKQRSVRADRIFENPFYSVQLQHAGRRMELSLGTANQAGRQLKLSNVISIWLLTAGMRSWPNIDRISRRPRG